NIEITFMLTLPNINHRFGYGANTINLGNWYPIACVYENGEFFTKPYSYNGDPFYSEIANYKVTFSCPESYIIANTGVIETENVTSGVKTVTAKAKAVRDFALVLSSKFEVLSQEVGETTVKYYYYDDENATTSLQTAVDSLNTFNDLIGTYPYHILSVVETNFVHGGMEYPNLVYISDAITDYLDYKNVIIHEIAHQWWYGVVGNNEFTEGWLDEGLTEYTTLLFYKLNAGYERDIEEIVNNVLDSYLLFTDVYKQVFGTVNTSMNRALDEYTTSHEYVYMAYAKGMLLFENLNSFVGDKKFYMALKQYYADNKMQIATQTDIVAAFEKATGADLSSFFNAWVNGTVVIENIK
ncbi:MAG: M1 family metallopeptidase, partial [Clostridia bacterium]|nr:M1 family metallopeptidase [Clostridia bacterium]